MKVTRNAPGNYTAITADGREWTVVRNPQLGRTPWVAYADRNTVLDPFATLAETLAALGRILSRVEVDARRYRFLRDGVDYPVMQNISQRIGEDFDRVVDNAMHNAGWEV